MTYHFDGDVAEKFGTDCATFISHMQYWIAKNAANERHFYEGRYWTYNSLSALERLFPFWTRRQIERIIRDLERAKAPPALLGFGISTPEHVRRALEAGAAGVIVGSALVKIVSEHLGDRDAMLKALGSAAASFKAATRTA